MKAGRTLSGRPSIDTRGLALTQVITAVIYLAAVVTALVRAGAMVGYEQRDGSANLGTVPLALYLVLFFFPMASGTLGAVGMLVLITTPLTRRSRWWLIGC